MSARASARADTGQQLEVEDVIASARADTVASSIEDAARAAERVRQARADLAAAEEAEDKAIYAAARAGASCRRLAAAVGMGKTRVNLIARYGTRYRW